MQPLTEASTPGWEEPLLVQQGSFGSLVNKTSMEPLDAPGLGARYSKGLHGNCFLFVCFYSIESKLLF